MNPKLASHHHAINTHPAVALHSLPLPHRLQRFKSSHLNSRTPALLDRRICVCLASAGNDDAGGSPDIDRLASLLAREASKLRSSFDEEEFNRSYEDPEAYMAAAKETPFGALSPDIEALLLEEMGPPGFDSDEFEVLQRLGRISVGKQTMDPSGGVSPTNDAPRTAVIAYVARYEDNLPFREPILTLIKEYLPMARPVACNELLLLKRLCGIPTDKHQIREVAEGRPTAQTPPVIPLLGYFTSIPSQDATMMLADDDVDSIWLIYKWEALRPLDMFMAGGPPQPITGFFKSKEKAARDGWVARQNMLRAIFQGVLRAVDYCHSADVVHGSLSTGSVMLSSCEDADAEVLRVKLDGFGFGKWFIHQQLQSQQAKAGAALRSLESVSLAPTSDDAVVEEGKRLDLQACALVLLEVCVSCCLAPSGAAASDNRQSTATVSTPSEPLDRPSLQRLVFDVFHDDILLFRNYCLQDSERYGRLVEFLDGPDGGIMNAGWGLMSDMLTGRRSALELSQHSFLTAATGK